MLQDKIFHDLETTAGLLMRQTRDASYEAARMMMPIIIKLDSYFDSAGLDAYIELCRELYCHFHDVTMKEIVVALSSEVLARKRTKGLGRLNEQHVDFFVDISIRHIKRALWHIVNAAEGSPSGKVLVYQNLRMGGMYPPMEADMKHILASEGYSVFEPFLYDEGADKMGYRELCRYADALKDTEDYRSARIILMRFKVSSAPEPQDSTHPQDYIPLCAQANNFKLIKLLAHEGREPFEDHRQTTAVIMIDGSKNRFSLAQEQAAEDHIMTLNAIDFMAMGFCYEHLYWLSSYGFNNIDELLPASSGGGNNGSLYPVYACRAAKVIKESDFFREVQNVFSRSGIN